MGVSDSQKRATQKYNEKNKERRRYLSMRSSAKSFVNKYSTHDDLKIIAELINNRLNSAVEDNDTITTSDIERDIDDKSYTGDSNIDDTCTIDKGTFDSTYKTIKKSKYYDKLDEFIKFNNIDLTDKKAKSKAVKDFQATFDNRSERTVQNDFKNYIDINQIGK